jgi:hypothetical protein
MGRLCGTLFKLFKHLCRPEAPRAQEYRRLFQPKCGLWVFCSIPIARSIKHEDTTALTSLTYQNPPEKWPVLD